MTKAVAAAAKKTVNTASLVPIFRAHSLALCACIIKLLLASILAMLFS